MIGPAPDEKELTPVYLPALVEKKQAPLVIWPAPVEKELTPVYLPAPVGKELAHQVISSAPDKMRRSRTL